MFHQLLRCSLQGFVGHHLLLAETEPQPSYHILDAWAAKGYAADVQCNVLHGLLSVHKRVLPQGSLSYHDCCEWQFVEHMMERWIFSEDENLPSTVSDLWMMQQSIVMHANCLRADLSDSTNRLRLSVCDAY